MALPRGGQRGGVVPVSRRAAGLAESRASGGDRDKPSPRATGRIQSGRRCSRGSAGLPLPPPARYGDDDHPPAGRPSCDDGRPGPAQCRDRTLAAARGADAGGGWGRGILRGCAAGGTAVRLDRRLPAGRTGWDGWQQPGCLPAPGTPDGRAAGTVAAGPGDLRCRTDPCPAGGGPGGRSIGADVAGPGTREMAAGLADSGGLRRHRPRASADRAGAGSEASGLKPVLPDPDGAGAEESLRRLPSGARPSGEGGARQRQASGHRQYAQRGWTSRGCRVLWLRRVHPWSCRDCQTERSRDANRCIPAPVALSYGVGPTPP